MNFLIHNHCLWSIFITLKLFCFISFSNSVVIDTTVCQTPEGDESNCIFTKDCPFMMDVLKTVKRPLSENVQKQLQTYICNTSQFKVCCPIRPVIIKEDTADIQQKNAFLDITSHPNYHLLPESCGYFDISAIRIINGMNADITEYPWMALLTFREPDNSRDFRCGGTIINERYILTAAHCLEDRSRLISVRVGEYDKSSELDCVKSVCNDPTQDITIEERIPHRDFQRTSYENDIGLLRVTPIKFNQKNIRPICLPREDSKPTNEETVEISGWGLTQKFGRSTSTIMQKATLPVVTISECQKIYENYTGVVIDDRLICAGGGKNDSYACRGDSGGPIQALERYNNNIIRYVQHGIVSLGPRSCDIPSTFTKVKYFMTWILNNMKP